VFRTKLGPDFVFVLLEMELDDMKERVIKRHDGDPPPMDWLEVTYFLYDLIFL
jgi:AmiR/NasT family two-component response regulator